MDSSLCTKLNCAIVYVLLVCTGIGQGRVTNNVQGAPIDYAHLILDTEAVAMVILYNLSHHLVYLEFKSSVAYHWKQQQQQKIVPIVYFCAHTHQVHTCGSNVSNCVIGHVIVHPCRHSIFFMKRVSLLEHRLDSMW